MMLYGKFGYFFPSTSLEDDEQSSEKSRKNMNMNKDIGPVDIEFFLRPEALIGGSQGGQNWLKIVTFLHLARQPGRIA